MVFKKPRNSRDDKSGRSSNKTTHADDKSKKSSTPRGKSSMGSDKTNNTKGPKNLAVKKRGNGNRFHHPANLFKAGHTAIRHQAVLMWHQGRLR